MSRRAAVPTDVERHLFVQRGADPLGEAAVDLTVHDHRIDQLAAILDDHIIENFDVADLGIDRDQGSVGGIAERAGVARRLVTDCGLEAARIHVARKVLRFQVPGAGDLAETDRALGTDHLAAAHRHARLHSPAGVARRP